MEDKFGYLMKAEAEEHLVREMIKKNNTYSPQLTILTHRMRMQNLLEKQNEIVVSWGGRHTCDKEVYKIRGTTKSET